MEKVDTKLAEDKKVNPGVNIRPVDQRQPSVKTKEKVRPGVKQNNTKKGAGDFSRPEGVRGT
jgi:hypothetical protein